MEKSCTNCKWAEWQKTLKNRIKQNIAGKCRYPEIVLPAVPACTSTDKTALDRRSGIWPGWYGDCPTWELDEKPQ